MFSSSRAQETITTTRNRFLILEICQPPEKQKVKLKQLYPENEKPCSQHPSEKKKRKGN